MKKTIAILIICLIFLTSCDKSPAQIVDLSLPQEDFLQKDETISTDIKDKCFDFAIEHHIISIPVFKEGETPEFDYMLSHVINLCSDEIIEYGDEQTNDGVVISLPSEPVERGIKMPVSTIKRVAKEKFDIEYDYEKYGDAVELEAGDTMGTPVCEVIQYKEKSVKGGKVIAARFVNYNNSGYMMSDTQTSEKIKNDIISGNGKESDIVKICDIKFETDKNGNLKKVLSYSEKFAPFN